jgi:hypothetical protein
MTEQDLQQLRQVIREEIRPIVQDAIQPGRAEFIERLDAAVVSISHDFSDLRSEMTRRLETLERRTERIETSVNAIQFQTAGMSQKQ